MQAAEWYERERPGLGTEFMNVADAALNLLEQGIAPLTSLGGNASSRGVKRLLLRRFPYAIVVLLRDTEIFVIAFAHHARRPGYWRARIRS